MLVSNVLGLSKQFSKIGCRSLVTSQRFFPDLSKSEVLDKAKELLHPFGDGEINLCKDEASGVASLMLKHAGKKNAMSGKYQIVFWN